MQSLSSAAVRRWVRIDGEGALLTPRLAHEMIRWAEGQCVS